MLQSKQIIEKDTTIYVITHGRPNPKDRPTTWWLEESGLPFKELIHDIRETQLEWIKYNKEVRNSG